MKHYIKLIRLANWIKNFLIFVPLFFSFTSKNDLCFESLNGLFVFICGKLILPFLLFSLLASSVYIINDIFDLESDKYDAVKKYRPIASGKVSIKGALVICVLFLILSFGICWIVTGNVVILCIMLVYLLLNLLYSYKLKHIPIVDIVTLSMFYMLRLYYSAIFYGIPISIYLYLLVLSCSLYFGVCKRMTEDSSSRKVLNEYNENYLPNMAVLFIALSIFYYSLWVKDYNGFINSHVLQFSVIIVICIFMLYHHIVLTEKTGNPVDVVLKNKGIIILVLIYICLLFIGICI